MSPAGAPHLSLLFPVSKFPKVYLVTFFYCVLYIIDFIYTHELNNGSCVDNLAQGSRPALSLAPLLYFLMSV